LRIGLARQAYLLKRTILSIARQISSDMLILMNTTARALVFALITALALPLAVLRADDTNPNVVLKSDDGLVQLSAPDGWVKLKSSTEGASLEARDEDSEAFIMVIIADRTDPYITIDEYGSDLRDQVLAHLVKSKCSQGEPMQIGGFKAIRYEIHGVKPESKVPFGYFVTIIQMRRHYVEVIAWSLEKHFPDNAELLRNAAKNVSYSGDQ
jgi:hypothetical protein